MHLLHFHNDARNEGESSRKGNRDRENTHRELQEALHFAQEARWRLERAMHR